MPEYKGNVIKGGYHDNSAKLQEALKVKGESRKAEAKLARSPSRLWDTKIQGMERDLTLMKSIRDKIQWEAIGPDESIFLWSLLNKVFRDGL